MCFQRKKIFFQIGSGYSPPPLKLKQEDSGIFQSLLQNVLDRLPLPAGFDCLSAEYQKQAREVLNNKSLGFNEKNAAVKKLLLLFQMNKQFVNKNASNGKQCCWGDGIIVFVNVVTMRLKKGTIVL